MSLESLVGLGSKDLGVRFNLVGVLPAVVLALLILAGVWSGAPASSPDLGAVGAKLSSVSAGEVALLALGILAFSLVLHPLQLSLVRLLEGYWGEGRAGRTLAGWGRRRHQGRRRELDGRTRFPRPADRTVDPERARSAMLAAWELRRLYPGPDRVLPTSLGNVLRAAEDRAGDKYGLDAVLVWPRLFPQLSEGLASALDDARNQLDVAARFAVTFLLAVVAALILFTAHGWWVTVAAGAAGLAWLSYRAAVNAAIAYGELMETAFDLHRFDLLKALHVPLPPDHKHELETNATVTEFLRRDFRVELEYDHGAALSNEPDDEGA